VLHPADFAYLTPERAEPLGHRHRAAGPLPCVAEDVDVGRWTLDLPGFNGREGDHETADQTPADLVVAERLGDLGDRPPKRHRVWIQRVNRDHFRIGNGVFHHRAIRSLSRRVSNSSPTRAERESR
jgi:hypothetical protein